MSNFVIWFGLVTFVIAFITWIIGKGRPDLKSLTCANGILTKRDNRGEESIRLSDLSEIKYHYHAVVGFISQWEFINRQGQSLSVDGETPGIETVLSQLEELLPGFSLNEFKTKFDEGDVEDTIHVWSNE